jgi:hypothetical protein
MCGFGLGFHAVEEQIIGVMEAENLHVMEAEIHDAEHLLMIEEEHLVPVSASRKPKLVKLVAPLRLIRSGKMADRLGNRKAAKHRARKHVRSDGMVLNFDEIVPEEGADEERGNDKRKTQYLTLPLDLRPAIHQL